MPRLDWFMRVKDINAEGCKAGGIAWRCGSGALFGDL